MGRLGCRFHLWTNVERWRGRAQVIDRESRGIKQGGQGEGDGETAGGEEGGEFGIVGVMVVLETRAWRADDLLRTANCSDEGAEKDESMKW
jgi:hypothetical protein